MPHRALTELQRMLGVERAAHGAPRRPRRHVRVRLDPADDPADRGRVTRTTATWCRRRSPNQLTVSKEALLEALRRVKILARDSASAVRLTLGGDTLTLAVRDQDYGSAVEELDVRYEGDEMTVGFNPDYLMSGVDADRRRRGDVLPASTRSSRSCCAASARTTTCTC